MQDEYHTGAGSESLSHTHRKSTVVSALQYYFDGGNFSAIADVEQVVASSAFDAKQEAEQNLASEAFRRLVGVLAAEEVLREVQLVAKKMMKWK